jgi:hypothetical protein
MAKTVPLGRSWLHTIGYTLAGAGLAFGSYSCHGCTSGLPRWQPAWVAVWVGVLAIAVVALGMLMLAFSESGAAKCIQCQAKMSGLDVSGDTPVLECEKCHTYYALLKKEKQLATVDDGHVADKPVYPVAVPPSKIHWPEECCVCGNPATRRLKIEGNKSQTGANVALGVAALAVGVVAIRTGGGISLGFEVPHCDAHEGGAAIEIEDHEVKDGQIVKLDAKLLFRGVDYARAFRMANYGQTLSTA